AEEIASRELTAHEEQGHRDTEHRRRQHRARAEKERIPEGATIEPVARELEEVRQRQASCLVAYRVVEDPGERVDQEDGQEQPDEADAEGGQRGGASDWARG